MFPFTVVRWLRFVTLYSLLSSIIAAIKYYHFIYWCRCSSMHFAIIKLLAVMPYSWWCLFSCSFDAVYFYCRAQNSIFPRINTKRIEIAYNFVSVNIYKLLPYNIRRRLMHFFQTARALLKPNHKNTQPASLSFSTLMEGVENFSCAISANKLRHFIIVDKLRTILLNWDYSWA